MSTLASSPAPQPLWKQEVNRRLAAHKSRKGISIVEENTPEEATGSGDGRAAAAAARVAARYAKAPSYSELQAAEARGALRVAEVATRAALDAQVAAQAALDKMTSSPDEDARFVAHVAASASFPEWEAQELIVDAELADERPQDIAIRWEPDMPALSSSSSQGSRLIADGTEVGRDTTMYSDMAGHIYEAVEAAQPIHANLIEFPRELVATRRMRPRLADAGVDQYGQLSIFEVEPSSISIDPGMPSAFSGAEPPSWSGAEWSAIELDEQPIARPDYYYEPETNLSLHQAPLGLRLMAAIVDAALVAGTVCGFVAFTASQFHQLPSQKVTELCAVIALVIFGVAYHALFLTLTKCTPGMRYAQLSLCTFDDEIPSREEVVGRLKAMALSLLPVGLGLVWAIFDEDAMSWHDRHSRTYLRHS